jgi:predicted nucleic acid-binding protein
VIAVDTSSMVAFLEGDPGDDTDLVQSALEDRQVVLPPVVLTELLSEPTLPVTVRSMLGGLPLLEVEPGFWERAGRLRAAILKRKMKARIADALIAQSCLDQSVPLVTRDRDFRHIARVAGLALL